MTEMSFPLLKLPYLCIESVLLNSDIHDVVIFSYISKRAYRLVHSLKSPVTSMRLYLEEDTLLYLEPMEEEFKSNCLDDQFVKDIAYYTSLFKCSVDFLQIDPHFLPENTNINFGFNKLKELFILGNEEISNDKLKYLLEHFEVTETIMIDVPISNTFHCDPKLFKAEVLKVEGEKSAGWITADFLHQLPLDTIHRLAFNRPQLTIDDVVAVITEWFHGRTPFLEGFVIFLNAPIEPVDWSDKCFKPVVLSPERRPARLVLLSDEIIELSDGLDIVRSDGQLATIYIEGETVVFHVWSEDERRGVPS